MRCQKDGQVRTWVPPIPHVRVADQKHYDCFAGEEVQQNVRNWLSPPDPWKNHKIACESQLAGTATWWIQGRAYAEWNSAGSSALLWIHGKRACFARSHFHSLKLTSFTSSAGAGKSVLWYVNPSVFILRIVEQCYRPAPQS